MNKGLPTDAWVLVADGEKALFLINTGDKAQMCLNVREKMEQENPAQQDWAANRPGRFNDGPSIHRSAVEDTDWHALEKERFAKDIAEILYKAAHDGKFDDLVIVASRPVLSALRKEVHSTVEERILLELPKILTNHPLEEIEKLIAQELNQAG